MVSLHFLSVFIVWVMTLLITSPLCQMTKDKVSPRALRIASRMLRIVFATIAGPVLSFYLSSRYPTDTFFNLVLIALDIFFSLFLFTVLPFTALIVGLFELGWWMILQWLMMFRHQENTAKTEASANASTSTNAPESGTSEQSALERRVFPLTELFLSIPVALSFFVFLELSQTLELFPEYPIEPMLFEKWYPLWIVSVDSNGRIYPWNYGRFVKKQEPGMSLNVPETRNAFRRAVVETIPNVGHIFYYRARRNADGLLEVRFKDSQNRSRYILKDGELVQAYYDETWVGLFTGTALWLVFCLFAHRRYDRWKRNVLIGA